MSNQIVISSGAKVRNLNGVLTGTAGIVNSVPLGGANGVATLDALGKVPLSQLPASVVTYLGTWNAATNTPTLTNGVGDVGDLYICNVAGTVNFGAGPITFAVGDWVIYSGTQWQKSAGASGTVTSVAVTESGDALTITGSPITTAGTINIGFAGTGAQYVKGDGTLATFPTTIDQAKKLITEVYNSTGSTLTKGTVVYINGGQGNLPTVTKAQANNDANSAQTYGVVQSDITNNNNGFVVVIGSLTDLDTQAYAVGTQLYLSGTTAGEWTSTKPSAPIHLVYVAIVVRSHPTQGVVEVRIQNGYELDEIHDVAISSPVNNQGIFYNSSNDLWENKSIATALGYTPANDSLVVKLAGSQTISGQKTFSSTLFGTDAEFSGSILSPIVSILDSSTYTKVVRLQTLAATNRDVYFPDLNGTVALLEGTQTFTGDKTFNGGVDFNNALNINNTFNLRNNLVGSTLYTNFSILKSGSTQTFKLLFSTTNASNLVFNDADNYTYTFPSVTGTIALLEGSQTFSGDKTFSGDILATNYYRVQQNASLGVAPSGYSTFGAINTKLNFGVGVAVSTQKVFQFETSGLTNNTTRVYTLPDASGTLALTSNLSSYVPYTGATSVVNLGTNNLIAKNTLADGLLINQSGSGSIIAGYTTIRHQSGSGIFGFLIDNSNTGVSAQLLFNSGTSYAYTFPNATGTIALTSNLSSYLPLTGGTLTGALSGTSATFSSSVTATDLIISDTYANDPLIKLATTTSGNVEVQMRTASTTYNAGIGVVTSGYDFNIFTNNTPRLTISSTGAATFSGNVGINGGSTNFPLVVKVATNQNLRVSTETYTAVQAVNDAINAFVTLKVDGNPLILNSQSGGNVGIGTASPAEKLHIYGGGSGPEVRLEGSYGSWYIRAYNDNFNFYSPSGRQNIRCLNNGDNYNYNNTTTWQTTSDSRVKENINTISNALNTILSLNPVTFDYKQEFAEKNNWDDNKKNDNAGFIAQEFETIFPKYTSTSEYVIGEALIDDFKSIDTGHLVAYLVKAIQELAAEVELLKNK